MIDSPETCAQCGFDSTEWNLLDTRRTIGLAAPLFDLWTERMSPEAVNQRPASDTWSALEYADHTRETLFGVRVLCEVAIESPGTDLGEGIDPAAAGPARRLDRESVFAALDAEATTFASRLAELDDEQWHRCAVIGGETRSVAWAARHAVHDLWHHLVDIADGRVATGDATPTDAGTVVQVNASGGGVPKAPVEVGRIGRRGIDGDVQRARLHHGRPWQALCLWSADVIDELRAEGHPITAGAAGENLTLRGLDWNALRAGSVLEIGAARCRLSAAAVPCGKNARWFTDGDFERILHDRHPGSSRWYAAVLAPGEVRAGDEVRVVA
ncbi:MAG: MOSC domain-containing protein [Acidimicrobiales bacterium]